VAGISPSIAVLPFEHRSVIPDDEYFVDGARPGAASSVSVRAPAIQLRQQLLDGIP